MTSGAPLLVADKLCLGYGQRTVVADINLSVARGDFWFLLGRNGSGKSTFARAVLGLLAPQSGQLRYPGGSRSAGSIGFVPQHCVLHPTLPSSLREFVELGFGTMKTDRATRAERVATAIDAVGLGGHAASDVRSLSGGQRQRAMVARALVRSPDLLVLDEPTSNLDPAAEEALLLVLERLHQSEGLALLFVCHDVAVAARHATHVALFHDGTVETGGRQLLDGPDVLRRVYGLDLGSGNRAVGSANGNTDAPSSASAPRLGDN